MSKRFLIQLLAATALFATVQICHSDPAPDLTGMSLDALLRVELPPLSSSSVIVVSATAVESCSVETSDLAFGTYDPLTPVATDALSGVVVTCTPGVVYDVGLNAGAGAGATTAARRMTLGEQNLIYSLYRDTARSLPWGDQVGVDSVAGVGSGVPVSHKIYGRIPARQTIRSGHYVDTVVVTVYY